MKKIFISEVISQAWELTKKHWLVILACMIIIYIAQMIVSTVMGGTSQLAMMSQLQALQNGEQQDPLQVLQMMSQIMTASIGSSIVCAIVSFILNVGLTQSVLNCARGNGQFSIDAWKQPANVYVKICIAQIIVSFLTYIGCLLCILPGLYIAARLQFTTMYLLDHKEASITDGIKASWDMTQQEAFTLVGLMFVYLGINILGLLCCCVGIVGSAIITLFAGAVCYFTLTGEKVQAAANTDSSKNEGDYSKQE